MPVQTSPPAQTSPPILPPIPPAHLASAGALRALGHSLAIPEVCPRGAPGPWSGHGVQAAELVLYTIRIPDVSVTLSCPRCGVDFHAAGPTGHADDDPVCDRCFLAGSHTLGMVLGLVSMARSFAVIEHAEDDEYREALDFLGAFARIYERFASRYGPPRYFKLPSWQTDP